MLALQEAELSAELHLASLNLELAEANARLALELAEPLQFRSPRAVLVLGQIALERGDTKEALTWLRTGSKMGWHKLHTALIGLVCLKERNGHWKDIWALYSHTARLHKDVGEIENLPGREDEAQVEASFRIMIASQPERPLVLAKRDIEIVLKDFPENLSAKLVKATLLAKDGAMEQAKALLLEVSGRAKGELKRVAEEKLAVLESR